MTLVQGHGTFVVLPTGHGKSILALNERHYCLFCFSFSSVNLIAFMASLITVSASTTAYTGSWSRQDSKLLILCPHLVIRPLQIILQLPVNHQHTLEGTTYFFYFIVSKFHYLPCMSWAGSKITHVQILATVLTKVQHSAFSLLLLAYSVII